MGPYVLKRISKPVFIASVFAAVFLLMLSILSIWLDWEFPFTNHGEQWRMVISAGCVQFGNQPQIISERGSDCDVYSAPSVQPVFQVSSNTIVRYSDSPATNPFSLRNLLASTASRPYSSIAIPFICFVLPFMIYPLWRYAGDATIRRRRRRGLCISCGYDIRANCRKCPECGME